MRRLLTLAIGSGVLAVAVSGCGTSSDDTPPGPALEMSCDNPAATDLGVPTVRRPARLTTSGGRHRFVVTGLPTGSIFGEIEVEVCPDVTLSDVDPAQPEMGTQVNP